MNLNTLSINRYFFILFILPFLSCGQQKKNDVKTSDKKSIYKNVTKFALDYYKEQHPVSKDDSVLISYEDNDSTIYIELRYRDEINTDSSFSFNGSYSIPTYKEGFVCGDLNNDSLEDIIVPVFSQSGGNAAEFEYFLFITSHDTISFFKMYRANDLGHCTKENSKYGEFTPDTIKNNILYGSSTCWTEEDATCCPSLEYKTEYKFKNGLVFFKQGEKKVISDNK